MRRGMRSVGAVLLVSAIFAGLGSATATAGVKKLVEGTVYETTSCGISCSPCPPPCGGPIPAPQSRNDVICAQQKMIVCPLIKTAMPIYSGEGAVVHVRKKGSSAMLASLAVTEGHFQIRLAPGEYVIKPYLPEPQCWSGLPTTISVTRKLQSPIPATLAVTNTCVAHPDETR